MKTTAIALALALSALPALGAQMDPSHIDHTQDRNWDATVARIKATSASQHGGRPSIEHYCEPKLSVCSDTIWYTNTEGYPSFLIVHRNARGTVVQRFACHLNHTLDVRARTSITQKQLPK